MSGELRDMFIAPAGVTTAAQWARWWLTSKLRGPILDMLEHGLTNVPRPSFSAIRPSRRLTLARSSRLRLHGSVPCSSRRSLPAPETADASS